MNETEKVCCPRFEPSAWDEKLVNWENKKFIKDHVFTLFYIPMNFGSVIKRMMAKVDAAHAYIPDYLVLADHVSRWRMELYMAVDKDIPGAENITISGKILSKVYEGDFRKTGEWCEDFKKFAHAKELAIDKWYMWYTTCPKCAKKFGKNYVTILGGVSAGS